MQPDLLSPYQLQASCVSYAIEWSSESGPREMLAVGRQLPSLTFCAGVLCVFLVFKQVTHIPSLARRTHLTRSASPPRGGVDEDSRVGPDDDHAREPWAHAGETASAWAQHRERPCSPKPPLPGRTGPSSASQALSSPTGMRADSPIRLMCPEVRIATGKDRVLPSASPCASRRRRLRRNE